MTPRGHWSSLAAGAAIAVFGPSCSDPGPSAEGRNVVLVVVDTLRSDRLPFYGCEEDTAPFLSSLAERSLLFENAWAASSWTAPSTASIFTGLHPNEHGVEAGFQVNANREEEVAEMQLNRIPESLETIPTFMKSLGYRTFGVSDNPNVDRPMGFDRGFDRFVRIPAAQRGGARRLNEQVLEWKDDILRESGPFFLYLHYLDPHAPYRRHEEWMPDGAQPPPENPMEDLAAYDSEIRHVDESLRAIFDELGLGENTLFVFTSDHGQEFREHGGVGHPWQLYAELTRVPLFIHWTGGGGPIGRVVSHATHVDLLPTLRALLGGEVPAGQISLISLDQRHGSSDRPILAMRAMRTKSGERLLASVVRGKYKLIYWLPSHHQELYDIEADPGETRDLAPLLPKVAWLPISGKEMKRRVAEGGEVYADTREYLDIVADLRTFMEEQRAAAKSFEHESFDYTPTDEEAALIHQLGYTGKD